MQGLLRASSLVFRFRRSSKEAYFHENECITTRRNEWVETIEHGWNRIWTESSYKKQKQIIDDFGGGDAAEKCSQF